MSLGCSRGEGAGGALSALLRGENFHQQGLKQGILVHFEQIVKGGGGSWISPLCTTVSKLSP